MAKILLVEDDKSLREIYGVRLMAEGYEIVSAGDGEEALAMAIKERPDLIVSDVMMPKISGFDMLDILRSTSETKDVKVIMMTALSSDDQRARGESLGADRYLVKSQVGIEDVVRTVHDVLGDGIGAAAPATPPAPVADPAPAAPAPLPDPVASIPPAPVAPEPVAAPTPLPEPAFVPAEPVAEIPPMPAEPILAPEAVAPSPYATPEAPAPVYADPAPAAPAPLPDPVASIPPAPVAPEPVAFAPAPEPAFVPVEPTPAPAAAPFAPPAPVAAPVFAPAPAPVTPQSTTISELPANPAPLPQPTAPFSSPAPASLGERVIEPLTNPAAPEATDIASQMEQALNGAPSSNQGVPPVPPAA